MTLQQLRYAVAIAEHKSMNKAAAELFITQPSLSNTIKDLENEIHTEIFVRSNRGIAITPKGEEFLGYARQMLDHYRLIEERYVENATRKKKFSVSMQHYTFAVEAFIQMAKAFGMDEYEYAAIPLNTDETMTIGYIKRKRMPLSILGEKYIEELEKYREKVL